ncbi:MAG: inositol monophosphatase [Burkholderiales bacterium]|nr:inositol monophosphatase [Burkholderiales bacterium]
MTETELADRYEAARWIARAAGQLALDYFRNRDRLEIEVKGPADYVTHADRDVENTIRRELVSAFPDDSFLGEETAALFTGPLDRCWVVDPIDGTHNFLRGVPYWNVAIGFVAQGRTEVGVVYDPPADALYYGRRGGGAFVQAEGRDLRIRAAATRELTGSYVALGHHDRAYEARYFDIRKAMMEAGIAMRNFGSAALQLAHVACGRLDGFIELQLSSWDAVAGLLLVEEAGGYRAPFAPPAPTAKAMCMACAPGIAKELSALVLRG